MNVQSALHKKRLARAPDRTEMKEWEGGPARARRSRPWGKYRLRPHRQFDAMNCPVSRVRHLNAMQP